VDNAVDLNQRHLATDGGSVAPAGRSCGPGRQGDLRCCHLFGGGDDAADQVAGVERGEVDGAAVGNRFERGDQRGDAMLLVAGELFGLLDGRGGMR